MAWMKSGDNAATYPALMSVRGMEGADERAVNEIAGLIWRAATLAAAHATDYVIDVGTLDMLAGSRSGVLLSMCIRAGLLREEVVDGIRRYVLIADPEFIHMRLKDELHRERKQRNDTRQEGFTVPVRLRDGDNCRWCGILVQWMGRKSNRSAEIDHLDIGEETSPDRLVVACRTCNGARKANQAFHDDNVQLRPAPTTPNFGEATAKFLTENGYPTEANVRSDEQLRQHQVTEQAAAVAPQRPPSPEAPGAPRAIPRRSDKETTKVPPEVPDKSLPCSPRTSSAGSGRDGTVRVDIGTGLSGQGSGGPPGGTTWPDGSTESGGGSSAGSAGQRRSRGKRSGRKRRGQGDSK